MMDFTFTKLQAEKIFHEKQTLSRLLSREISTISSSAI